MCFWDVLGVCFGVILLSTVVGVSPCVLFLCFGGVVVGVSRCVCVLWSGGVVVGVSRCVWFLCFGCAVLCLGGIVVL